MTDVGILGADAVRGNADALGAVSQFLRSTADEIQAVRGTLLSHTLHGSWEGAAAQAFRLLLNDTPDDLAKAARSYEHAADAVGTYVARLRGAEATAQSLAARLADALNRAGQGDRAINAAQAAVDAARRVYNHTTDPAALHRARLVLDDRLRALSNAQHARGAVQGEVDALRRQAADNRRTLDAAAGAARELLHQASLEGIRNANAVRRAGSMVINGVKHDVKHLVHAAAKVLHEAAHVLHSVHEYFKTMSWKKLSEILDYVGIAMAAVALVAVIVIATAATGGAAAVIAAGAYETVTAVGIGLAAAKTGVDIYRYSRPGHDGVRPLDLVADGLSLGLAGAGAVSKGSKLIGNEVGVMRALHPVGDFIPEARVMEQTWGKIIVKDMIRPDAVDFGKELAFKAFDIWGKGPTEHLIEDVRRDPKGALIHGLKGLVTIPPIAPILQTPLTQIIHKITIPHPEYLLAGGAMEAR
jgi:uncharacterized protein YukE